MSLVVHPYMRLAGHVCLVWR